MSSFSQPIATSAPFNRSIAIAALMGATMLAFSLTAAHAGSVTGPAIQLAQADVPDSQAAKEATGTKAETVEQRITNLHTALKITPDENSKWNNVAQAMRENAAAMQKLAADRTTKAPESMTAVQDLEAYQKFAQTRVDGLKNLTSSFKTLYSAMPDAQKKVADDVFESFARERTESRG